MTIIRYIVLALSIAPAIAFSASQPEESDADDFRVINPQVNAWAGGTVSKAGDGTLVIQGAAMPFLTARAQMHQEMAQKLSGVDDPQQRMKIAKEIKAAWDGKLDAAASAKKGEAAAHTFKAPAEADALVILDAKSVRELPAFQKAGEIKEKREKMGLEERDVAKLYAAREERLSARAERREERSIPVSADGEKRKEAAGKVSEKGKERVEAGREKLAGAKLTVNDLKPGDKVIVGYNSEGNVAFTIIQSDAK
jgi:hypothetical protein